MSDGDASDAPKEIGHPWHDLDPGPDYPNIFHAVIEVPRGSKVKYRLDPATGLIAVANVLGTSVVYPHNYGFVPQTMDEDGAALDVLVIMSEKVHPFSFLRAKPVGVVRMTENNRPDSKLIAVHADDPAYRDFGDVHELPAHRLTEISRFLEDYRTFEGRLAGPPVSTPKVSVDGFEDALAARLLLKEAQAAYKAAFLPKRPRTG